MEWKLIMFFWSSTSSSTMWICNASNIQFQKTPARLIYMQWWETKGSYRCKITAVSSCKMVVDKCHYSIWYVAREWLTWECGDPKRRWMKKWILGGHQSSHRFLTLHISNKEPSFHLCIHLKAISDSWLCWFYRAQVSDSTLPFSLRSAPAHSE